MLRTALLVASLAAAQTSNLPRTFPQFTGTWTLDEMASTGRLVSAPGTRLTITTTPEAVSVAKVIPPRAAPPGGEAYRYDPGLPNPEVYRFDGHDTTIDRTAFIYSYGFRLVADRLALSVKTTRRGFGGYTLVTDAYSVDGDMLIVDRQFTSVTAGGHIRTMQEPANNARHTFVYRRSPPAAE